jgi:hypothetical protein
MWEYGFHDDKFEIVIKVKHNPCADPVSLNRVSQSMNNLIDEFEKKVRGIMDYEYKDGSKRLCPLCKT